MPEIPLDFLDQLAEKIFPSLTSLTAIGRGEPLYLSDQVWDRLVGHIKRNHMLFSVVTNGVLLKKRITPELIPLIDTVTVSIDGLEQATFGENRGGASIEKVLNNVRYYHELRKQACLPRRPKLCLSWTMKRNNIHEMLPFLEIVKEFEPDIMFTRHLMIFHEKDREQSLVNEPELCNFHLEQVYARMKQLDIRTECPPIAQDQAPEMIATESEGVTRQYSPSVAAHTFPVPTAAVESPPAADPCMFVYRTANIHTDGKIHVCPRPNAPLVGNYHEQTFADIWTGQSYMNVRNSLDTTNEFEECRYCWYRESKYHPQRFQRDTQCRQNYSLLTPVPFSQRAWDFTERHYRLV